MDWTYTLTETDTIDNVTVTKRTVSKPDAQQSWNMAALAFTDESGGGFNGTASAILTDATFSHDLTDVASANHVVFSDVMGQVLYSGFAPGSNIFVINWRNSGGYKPKVYFKGTAADIAAYFAEHETVLTFN